VASKHRRPPGQEVMLGMITSYWVSQMLFVAAKLGVADVLAKGPLVPTVIAQRVGAQPALVHRLLRALASVGVFAEGAGGKFRLTPLAQMLRSGRPGSLRDFALMIVDDYQWKSWEALYHGVVSGDIPFDHVHGAHVSDYLPRHPEKLETFSRSMASHSQTQNAAIASAYPFGQFTLLADIGGSHGHLLATILKRYKALCGVLFDVPPVVEGAAGGGFISATGVRNRCKVIGGDFFAGVPLGADVYLMKYILHDWDDDHCVRLLKNCRDSMVPTGRVLIVEHLIAPGNRPDWGKLLDIQMFTVAGGQERTRHEFEELFKRAGLELKRVIPTKTPLTILECVRA